jgi:predicted helicase
MLPRIPTPETRERFELLADVGRRLSQLHTNYESADPYPLDVQLKPGADSAARDTWRVDKMRWRSKSDHSAILYNGHVTIAGIPDAARGYIVGSRTALDWLLDRYQIKTDAPSGIVNDPNEWCAQRGDPTYIVDLIKRITTVSIETMKLVDQLAQTTGLADAITI